MYNVQCTVQYTVNVQCTMYSTVHFIITLFNFGNALLCIIYQLNFTVFMYVTWISRYIMLYISHSVLSTVSRDRSRSWNVITREYGSPPIHINLSFWFHSVKSKKFTIITVKKIVVNLWQIDDYRVYRIFGQMCIFLTLNQLKPMGKVAE
jgi:hypothetical protein